MPMRIIKRSVLLPKIHEARRALLKSALSGRLVRFELKTYEFFTIAILYQLNISHVFFFLEMAIHFGAISVTILYIVLTGVLGVPLFLLFTFMSSYSRKGYLTFWKCVPLFEGLGYSLVLMRLVLEMQNSAIASFALLLLFKFLSGNMKSILTHCRGPNATCAPMYPKTNLTEICTAHKFVPTATQDFIFYIRNSDSRSFMEKINTQWIVTLTVTWILIFLLSVQGLRSTKKASVILVLLCLCLMFFIGSFALSNVRWSTIKRIKLVNWTEGKSILTFEFWVGVILHSSEMNVLAIVIWLGTLKPKSLHPKYAALVVAPLKLVGYVCILCAAACLTKETIVHYKYMDVNCFRMSAPSIVFSMMADILFRTKVYNLYIPLWYFCLFICSASTPFYSMIAIVDSILEKFKVLRKYRLHLITCLCLLCYLGSIAFMGKSNNALEIIWKKCVVPLWSSSMLLLVTLALFFIYSTRAVIDDYLFTYGCTPERYWITTWKTTPIFAILAFILVLHNDYSNKVCTANGFTAFVTHAMFLFGLLPFVVVLLLTCLKYVKRNKLHLLARPSVEWGPYGEEKKLEKSLFFPQRDIKYRNVNLRCSHPCLVYNNKDFRNKSMEYQRKLVILEEEYLAHKATE